MLAWSEGTDNGRQKMKSWLWRHCRRAIYWCSDHPRKLVHAKPKTQINRRRTLQLLSRWWDAYRKQLGLKDFSPKKSGRCGIAADWGVALYLWLIVVISVRQSTVAAISGLHCRAGYGQFEHKADSLIAKIQRSRAERSERLMYEQSHPRLSHALVICIIVCLSWAVNHYRDNAITYKPSATKMPENWSWQTRQLLTCRCVSVMLLRSMQNTRRLSWC